MATREYEQELAHVLVTELLAYQFAMPVRWSTTQSVLFDHIEAERVIEFGPSATLLSMAKKTLDQFNIESDVAKGVKRALLSINENHDEIHYETGPSQQLDLEDKNSACAVQSPGAVDQGPTMAVTTVTNGASPDPDTLVPDAPISALEAVRALLACSLKRPESEIKLEDSIRTLSRGRSTVQNEIIGDMLEEFGPLSEDVENVPLHELASAIQKSYDGKLGKCSRTRIEKMMASKMPGSFGLTSLRSYLSKRWGLASRRQDAVLLRALSQQPVARITRKGASRGPSSIGMAMLPSLLQGGARVVLTTSRPMSQAGPIYQRIFASHGGNDSKLVVLPCNQGSKRDIEDLVTYIYEPVNGLGWDLDFVIPFAALSEKGREIDNLDSHSELAHRAMLTNVLRLMGAIKIAKEARDFRTRPAQVILPLSPNIGTFGNDGLYSESKIGLVAVLNKWSSESWSDYLSVCGVTIGWTRGTGLMADNYWLAKQVAKLGITTFSTEEMACRILRLMSDPVVSVCQNECLVADISGGMADEIELAEFVANLRQLTRQNEEIRRTLAEEETFDMKAIRGSHISALEPISPLEPLVNLELGFPGLPDYAIELQTLNDKLNGMVDLESVVVVVGFAELGPWGNSRTRWEMDLNGELSIQGCVELAWMTGLIRYNKATAGWIDAASGTPIKDSEIKANYEKRILDNVGLRFINPSPLDHPSRDKKQILQEVAIQSDIEPFATSYGTAMEFVREHGDKVEIQQISGSDEYHVRFRRVAILRIPKATSYDRVVGGQIPTGWDPQVYGLPQDICENVDRCTLFALVCAAEAFLSAGITDVYELYGSLHVSELANCVGSGMGGGRSLQKLFVQRYLDHPVQNDILAETFINTTSAWLNMLPMSSAGPTRTPVGACATALESLNQGYDLIVSGAAKVCLVGGFDDMTQATSDEFANMRATNNSIADMNRGRAPHEMSRPCASSRCSFIESEGCGMQVITSAKIALELGLPIRAIIAHVQTASDGIGRSVPEPGKGIMTSVSENSAGGMSPLLDIGYRRRLLESTLKSIQDRNSILRNEIGGFDDNELSVLREEREARRRFGNGFWTHDPRISPLRGALAVWGLTADDIAVVSMHGTSTEMNEKNEVEVLHRQLSQLGRSTGNAALAVCQKYLTGHPKGPAAAWMLNGCCQILDTSIVPGNRNADNIDIALEPWEHLVFPDRSISIHNVNAFSMTSFGFGQKGAQALGVHPKFVFATLNHQQYDEYCGVRQVRYKKAQQHFQNAFYGGRMVTLKDEPPYPKSQQVETLIDASSRFG